MFFNVVALIYYNMVFFVWFRIFWKKKIQWFAHVYHLLHISPFTLAFVLHLSVFFSCYHDFLDFFTYMPTHHFSLTPQTLSENDPGPFPVAIVYSSVTSPHDWLSQPRRNFSNHPFPLLFPLSNQALSSLWSKPPLTRTLSPLAVWSPLVLSSPRLSFTLSVASLTSQYTRYPSYTWTRRPHSQNPSLSATILKDVYRRSLLSPSSTDVDPALVIPTLHIRFLWSMGRLVASGSTRRRKLGQRMNKQGNE